MSLQSSMAVMKAKLAGNEMQLKALAAQGDMEAAAALKELLDKKQLQTDVQNQGAMQTPEQPSVLDQMVQPPQSGIAAYAGGGLRRGFFEGGTSTADMINNPSEGGAANYNPIANWFRDKLYGGKTREQYYKEEPAMVEPAAGGNPNTDDRQKRNKANYSGIAAVAAPKATATAPADSAAAPSSGRPNMAAHTAGPSDDTPDLPAAKDLKDSELADVLAQMEPLQKKRDALRDKSREQLEKLYNETVKANTPSVWQKLAEMGSAMALHGGSNPWAALGAGGKAALDANKDRQKNLLGAQAAYQKADMLEQEAVVADQMKDVEGAYKLRQQAEALRKQIAAQKSTERLQEQQGKYYEKMGDAAVGKADAALTVAAKKGSGLGAAAGPKPMNQAQYVAAIQREAGARATADGKDMTKLSPQERDVYLRAAKPAVDALVAGQGKGAAASPAAPKSYDFGALMQGS